MNYKKFLKRFLITVLVSLIVLITVSGVLVYWHMQQRFTDAAAGKPFYLCYVAGRSGGHIIPALSHARQALAENPRARLLFISTDTPLDRALLEKAPDISIYKPIALDNVPQGSWRARILYGWEVAKALWQTCSIFWIYRPMKVVSMGGYISMPVALVAWILRIPIELHELNVIPGASARWLSRLAGMTITCFDETRKYLPKSAQIMRGRYPVRFKESDKLKREDACAKLGIDPSRKVLLVFGGSQGAHFFNSFMPRIAQSLMKEFPHLFVLHQTGGGDEVLKQVRASYAQLGVEAQVFAFRLDMEVLYSAADAVVARAGAGSIFELAFFGRRAVLIPLEPKEKGHQLENARAMSHQLPQLMKCVRQADIERDSAILHDALLQQLS